MFSFVGDQEVFPHGLPDDPESEQSREAHLILRNDTRCGRGTKASPTLPADDSFPQTSAQADTASVSSDLTAVEH